MHRVRRWHRTLAPARFRAVERFQLEDGLPTWTYAFADALLEQRNL